MSDWELLPIHSNSAGVTSIFSLSPSCLSTHLSLTTTPPPPHCSSFLCSCSQKWSPTGLKTPRTSTIRGRVAWTRPAQLLPELSTCDITRGVTTHVGEILLEPLNPYNNMSRWGIGHSCLFATLFGLFLIRFQRLYKKITRFCGRRWWNKLNVIRYCRNLISVF